MKKVNNYWVEAAGLYHTCIQTTRDAEGVRKLFARFAGESLIRVTEGDEPRGTQAVKCTELIAMLREYANDNQRFHALVEEKVRVEEELETVKAIIADYIINEAIRGGEWYGYPRNETTEGMLLRANVLTAQLSKISDRIGRVLQHQRDVLHSLGVSQ